MLHRILWTVWIVGTALVMLSWTDIVSREIGWFGFAAAGISAVVSYLPLRKAANRNWSVLTDAMLNNKDSGYVLAMKNLRGGGTVIYDGMCLSLQGGGYLTLIEVASAPLAELNDLRALEDAQRAFAKFYRLAQSSAEVEDLAGAVLPLVLLISEFGNKAIELCQIRDGEVLWKVKGKGIKRL